MANLSRIIKIRFYAERSFGVNFPRKKISNFSTMSTQINYDDFTNPMAKRRKPSMLREITHIVSKMPSDTISFAVGVPNSETFPFQSVNVNLKDGSTINLSGKDLSIALQYLPSRGYAPLISWLMNFQDKIHGQQDWGKKSLLVTSGGQEGLCNTIEMCLQEGDSIVVQRPVYPAVNDLVRPFLPNYIAIDQDQDGMRPDLLQSALEKCINENIPLPKLMYINPTGCNPSGVCLTTERKKEIYSLASKYNMLILEDDSYYYLHFLEKPPTSFLSMDTEGRVIRFDSFSKILSSGLRVGFVTGPEPLLRKIELHLQVSTLHTSALSQMILYKLLETWGPDNILAQFNSVQQFYKIKRDQMIASVKKHLDGLVDWYLPSGGMFLWLKVKGITDTYNLAMKKCIENSVVVIPGHPFISLEQTDNCPYIRLSYSLPSVEQMDKGCEKLARIIKKDLQENLKR